MYAKILIYYILGYVNITVEGFFIEKFINICISKRVLIWNTNRTKSTILHANVGVSDFRKVVKIAKSCKCKLKINRKSGLPFVLNKYRKRKIFAISLCVICAVIMVISNFVWNIEINGICDDAKKSEIMSLIKSQGYDVGKLKSRLNLSELINKIRIGRSDIAWVGAKIKGTNLIIEIVEADEKPEIVDESEYCNIVAKKDGVIHKVEAQNGTPIVKEGDIVKKGDILIKGEIEGKYTDNRLVHSEGDVVAKVWYSDTEKVYYNQIIANHTGESEKKYSINVNNFKINLFKTLSKFEKYDTIRTVKKLKVTSNFYLPIEVVVSENFEKQEEQISYSKEEAKELGIQILNDKLNNQIKDSKVSNVYINTKEDNDEYIEIEVIYEVLESIGTNEKI